MEHIKLAILPLVDAKGLQDQLKSKGVELVLNHNDQTCTRGCTVTVEVLGLEKDVEIIAKTYQENYQKLTDDFHLNKKIIDSVAIVPTKRLRNKIAGYTTHLMRRL